MGAAHSELTEHLKTGQYKSDTCSPDERISVFVQLKKPLTPSDGERGSLRLDYYQSPFTDRQATAWLFLPLPIR